MTIIVTGATGQDGSYMADLLLARGHTVVGGIRSATGPNLTNLKKALENPHFIPLHLDVADYHSVEHAIKKFRPDMILNFAANSYVGDSWECPNAHLTVNTMGVLNILEAVRKNLPSCRIYSAGSSEQFGDVLYSPQDIDHPFRPRSPYATSKCAAHHLVKTYRDSYNLFAVHGVLFNHESPRRGDRFVTQKIVKGVARIAQEINDGKPIEPIKLGNLDARRDWSHAVDFMEGIYLMMGQRAPKDYVLASGIAHSVREFVEKAFEEAPLIGRWKGKGLDEKYVLNGFPFSAPVSVDERVLVSIDPAYYRPAEVEDLRGNADPARDELGWTPDFDFDALVEDMVTSAMG